MMKLNELLIDDEVQKMINERLAEGQKFEVIMLGSGERMTFGASEEVRFEPRS